MLVLLFISKEHSLLTATLLVHRSRLQKYALLGSVKSIGQWKDPQAATDEIL